MGMKDYSYASLFDKKDLPYLYKHAEKVRTTHDQQLVDDFNSKCQKKWDDHNPILELGNKDVEFLQVSKADDLVVNNGINYMIDLILGTATLRYTYIFSANGTGTPAVTDTGISGTTFNSSYMPDFGWREYAGSSLRFGSVFGESKPSITVSETMIQTSASVILNRNIFSNNPIVHVINVTCYVISNVVEFVPVM